MMRVSGQDAIRALFDASEVYTDGLGGSCSGVTWKRGCHNTVPDGRLTYRPVLSVSQSFIIILLNALPILSRPLRRDRILTES